MSVFMRWLSFRLVSLCNVSGLVVKAPHSSSLEVRWVVRLEVQVPVCVHLFTVDGDVKFAIS